MLLGQKKTDSDLEQEEYDATSLQIRRKRDEKLKETDYMVLPDFPNPPEGLLSYRQALRDLTLQNGFPFHVEWPVLEVEDNSQ